MKASGDDTMMCGCEAKPAGGNMDKYVQAIGCASDFWGTSCLLLTDCGVTNREPRAVLVSGHLCADRVC